jgi:hypothetical protein
MAAACDVSPSTLGLYEAGKPVPRHIWSRLAELFGFNENWVANQEEA